MNSPPKYKYMKSVIKSLFSLYFRGSTLGEMFIVVGEFVVRDFEGEPHAW